MNRIVKILGCCVALALAACSQEPIAEHPVWGGEKGDGIVFTLSFPEMESVATRAFADSPTPDELDIFLFVFDGENLLQTIHIPTDYDGRTNDGGKIKFRAMLPQTDNNATVHIVAIDDKTGDFAAQIDANGYGVEDTVIPGLSVSGDTDAYWQRVAVGCPIKVGVNNEDNDLANVQGTDEQVKEVFSKTIHLVRNFAKVTLVSAAPNFTVLAWTVVNERDGGSVAPWYSTAGSTDIQYAEYNESTSYKDLTDAGYIGVSQAGAELRNTLDEIGTDASGDNWVKVEGNEMTTKYIYERRNTSVNPLYLLIYGELAGSSGSKEYGYYKLALGHTDHDTGIFTPYNVLRNIAYKVTINAVTGKGTSTPSEAAAGPASNNISGDVVTSNLTQISDGVDRLEVSFINYVVTTAGRSVDFRFRYTQNFTSTPNVNNKVVIFDDSTIGIKEGDDIVINEFSYKKDSEGKIESDADGWATIHIEFNDPSDVLKQQSFTLYSTPDYETDSEGHETIPETNTMGLSRTINFVLREPWDFIRMETYAGNWADDDQFPDWDDELLGEETNNKLVGPQKGAPLTVFFELPAGLPQAIFPLECTFESDRQNIENDGKGTAVVQTGPSLFGGVLDHRISYTKTVNWQDYAPDGESSTAHSRIQRARFVTTTNISNLEGTNYVSTIRLHNPYFNDKDDKFERDEDKPVNPPKNSVRTELYTETKVETTTEFNVVWNFSHTSWNANATSCINNSNVNNSVQGKSEDDENAGSPKVTVTTVTTVRKVSRVTKTVGDKVDIDEKIDVLSTDTKVEQSTPTNNNAISLIMYSTTNNRRMSTGYDTEGDRYFSTNYGTGNNYFRLYALTVANASNLVSSELKITAAPNDEGGSVTPSVAGNNLTIPESNKEFSEKQTNTYNITAGTGNTKYITIGAKDNTTKIRFYKIELTEKYYSDVTTNKDVEIDETVNSD